MEALNQRIVLVTRKTRLEDLIVRFNTVEQAQFYVEHLGADFSDYEIEHRVYLAAVRKAESTLSRFGRVQRLDRGFLANYLFAPDALVVVLGQDGLVANTLKYLKNAQPVIGINPDPARWDGVLLPFEVDDLASITP
jgi:NAD kinase